MIQRKLSIFPPKIPKDLAQLERAILLLGNRSKAELTPKPRRELEELIGTYPTLDQAVGWKMTLRRLRKRQVEESSAQTVPAGDVNASNSNS